MLDEAEFQRVSSAVQLATEEIQGKKVRLNLTLEQVVKSGGFEQHWEVILDLYEHMTGYRATDYLEVLRHRRSLLGRSCSSCRKPLRTPKARQCAECGATVES